MAMPQAIADAILAMNGQIGALTNTVQSLVQTHQLSICFVWRYNELYMSIATCLNNLLHHKWRDADALLQFSLAHALVNLWTVPTRDRDKKDVLPLPVVSLYAQ